MQMEKQKMLTIRVSEELLAAVDEWRARQRPIPTRAEAVRIAMEKFFEPSAPKK
jgi:metal-responsive CopG/Arc/MetJ family transcriptional regulator